MVAVNGVKFTRCLGLRLNDVVEMNFRGVNSCKRNFT